jgi:fructose-1,6-bisphosphatase/inositol monophosphatase family enzyme
LSTPDLQRVAALIEEVAATEIMPRFGLVQAKEKTGPHDLVTEADEAAERVLGPRLRELAPGALVGEEATAADPTLLGALERHGAAWLIDPVDGTLNFAAGLPLFGVMVAYVVNGDAVASWIHDPVRGITAIAERGGGAWIGSRRLAVSVPDGLAHMTGSPALRFGDREDAARIARRLDRVLPILSLRCSAQEYLALSEGRTHFISYSRTYPWDHAPGCLIAAEAGATVRRLDGTPYRACDEVWRSPLLVTASEESWGWVKVGLIDP